MIFVNFDGCYCEVLIFYRSMSLMGVRTVCPVFH